MKITDSKVIKSGEKGLIEAVTSDLNWQIVADILRSKYNLQLSDDSIDYQSGDIVVHNNQVAYRLDFAVNVTLSVLFNREGECVDVDVVRSDAEGAAAIADDFSGSSDAAAEDPVPAGSEPAPGQSADPEEEAGAPDRDIPFSASDSPSPSQVADMIASINRE